jgi:hypothetical protein
MYVADSMEVVSCAGGPSSLSCLVVGVLYLGDLGRNVGVLGLYYVHREDTRGHHFEAAVCLLEEDLQCGLHTVRRSRHRSPALLERT